MRPLVFVLCAALLAPTLLNPAQGAQAQTHIQAHPQAQVKKRRAKAAAKAPKVPKTPKVVAKPGLSQADLLAPYSAMSRQSIGPTPADGRQGAPGKDLEDRYQSNATSWKVNLSLDPKRLEEDTPLRFRVGREVVVDPLTKKELTPRTDPLKAQQSLRDLNLKGALDSVGGKAEVQVDVLKF
ncbi:MAG: hypothetical protein Q7I92_14520 [Humidesulfovibrio sp.]|nr:hypothetical protein [Humidesulfovibrio sp.]